VLGFSISATLALMFGIVVTNAPSYPYAPVSHTERLGALMTPNTAPHQRVAIVAVPGVGGTSAAELVTGAAGVVVGARGVGEVTGVATVVADGGLATAGWLVAEVVGAEVIAAEPHPARPAMQIPAMAIMRSFMREPFRLGTRFASGLGLRTQHCSRDLSPGPRLAPLRPLYGVRRA